MARIEDFIPYYPSIIDPDFNDEIYAKKELREELQPGETALRHQKLVSRYMSGFTMYNSVLIYHEMGTGKTCTAVKTAEKIFAEPNGINRALVIVRGQTLINAFLSEIVNVCAVDAYGDIADSPRLQSRIASKYEFDTYEMFTKNFKKSDNFSLYDNHVIIIDEIHNINTVPKIQYAVFHKFLHSVKNCKIILMSGTPMRNKASDIAEIMNLILPLDNQIPVEDFDMKFMHKRYTQKIQELKPYFKGRISYLKSGISDVPKVFQGEVIAPLTHFKVVPSIMSDFQTMAFENACMEDDVTKFMIGQRQASLIAFPNGWEGRKGFKTVLKRRKHKSMIGKEIVTYSITDNSFKIDISTIEGVRRLSTKYATVMETILANPRDLTLVYGTFVEGSGLVVLSKIFENMGFERAFGPVSSKGRRYALITGYTTSPNDVRSLIDTFNHPDNMYGEYIQVILGSRVISEGITLKNVQQVHVTTPHWHYAETDQVIARAYRTFSHDALIAAGHSPVVKIYQHVAIPNNGQESIDIHMYVLSEKKDLSTKRVERIIKEVAFDCPISRPTNYTPGHDNMRICDYQSCEYECETGGDLPIDSTTYNMYYSDPDVTKLLGEFSAAAIRGEWYDVGEEASPIVVSLALEKTKTVMNSLGITGYVNVDGDRVYVSPDMYDNGDSGNMYYFANPTIGTDSAFDDIVQKYIYTRRVPALLTDLAAFPDMYRSILTALPPPVLTQLLETSFSAPASPVRTNIQQYFSKYIHEYDGRPVVSFGYRETGKMRTQTSAGKWVDASQSVVDAILARVSDIVARASDIGYYGIVQNNKFLIKQTTSEDVSDKRKAPRGRACATIDRAEIDSICRLVGVDVDEKLSKKNACALLQKWFDDNNLIEYK